MNTAKKAFLTLCTITVIMAGTPLQAAAPEESFRKSFPDVPLESLTPTDIPGIYEIIAGGRILYYAPGPEYLIVGEILTREKKNLTQARSNELLAKKFKDLPLEKAVKIGSGQHTVIEITDPDCSFCRKASDYLKTRKDVTRYVFLYPLKIHPSAEAKIKYIFCAKDQGKTYEEAMSGKFDDMKFKPCDDAAVTQLIKTHKEVCEKLGVVEMGTPFFLIDNYFVRGANMQQMEKILGAAKK